MPSSCRQRRQRLPYRYRYCYGNCNSHLNSDTYSRSNPHTDSYGYGNSHTGPNHVDCAGLPSTRATESGLVLERRNFESGQRLPQRRVDQHHKERRFLHRSNRWPSAWHLYVSSVQCGHSDLFESSNSDVLTFGDPAALIRAHGDP